MDKPEAHPTPCPTLAPLPEKVSQRLIDKGVLHYGLSTGGFSERYHKGKTPHTIHVWWARRPFSAMRSIVFASLCKELSEQMIGMAEGLANSPIGSNEKLAEARGILSEQYNSPPKVLDMFGGGGTIGFEAANLGAHAYSMDSNQMAVFIQRCILEHGTKVNGQLDVSLQVKDSGIRVLEQLKDATEPLYPLRHSEGGPVIAYTHTYTVPCKRCGRTFSLGKRPWLSRKKGKETLVKWKSDSPEIRPAKRNYRPPSAWKGREVKCPHCKEVQDRIDIGQCQDVITALVRRRKNSGKVFCPGTPDSMPEQAFMDRMEKEVLVFMGKGHPKSELPRWSGIVNPALYGMSTHGDFLNSRQGLVLLFLIKFLREEYHYLEKEFSSEIARCITGHLSGLMDQLIDWNSRLSMWIPQNEQVGRAFCGPGVAMLWDYAETDPLLDGPANLWAKLDRIVGGVSAIPAFPHIPDVRNAKAQSLPYPNECFDAIVTDPPYYDNIFYTPLADFFFAWKRMLFDLVAPDLAGEPVTNMKDELVASSQRQGNQALAHEEYCNGLEKALEEAGRVLKDNGVLVFIYSHSSFRGWEALVQAFRNSPFVITSVQPLCVERKARPRAVSSRAVNTCLAIVARKRQLGEKDPSAPLARFRKICLGGFPKALTEAGWSEDDAGLAVFAQGAGLLANTPEKVLANGDLWALSQMEEMVREQFSSFKITKRRII